MINNIISRSVNTSNQLNLAISDMGLTGAAKSLQSSAHLLPVGSRKVSVTQPVLRIMEIVRTTP
jgi:hypothetical protein